MNKIIKTKRNKLVLNFKKEGTIESIKIQALGLEAEVIKPCKSKDNFSFFEIFSSLILVLAKNKLNAIYKRYKAAQILKTLNKNSYWVIKPAPKAQHTTIKPKPKSSPNIIHKVILYPEFKPSEKAKFIHRPGNNETQAKVKINNK